MTESLSKKITSAETHLTRLKDHLQDEEHVTKNFEDFNLEEFLTEFGDAVTEISRLSWQTLMAHKKPSSCSVKESHELINSIESASDNLVLVVNSLPKELGRRFHLNVFELTKGILSAVIDFIQSLSRKGPDSTRECVRSFDHVFSKCEKIHKMPKNNLGSVLNFLHKEEFLLLDALQEIDEEVKNNFSALRYEEEIDNTEMWNNQDKELLSPCIALMKTARFCLKKVVAAIKSNGNCNNTTNIQHLDEVALIVEELSPTVDNFVFAMYPPMNRKVVARAALKVIKKIQNLLSQVQSSHFVQEADRSWMNVILKAVDLKNNKLQPLFSDDERSNDIEETDASNESDEYDEDE